MQGSGAEGYALKMGSQERGIYDRIHEGLQRRKEKGKGEKWKLRHAHIVAEALIFTAITATRKATILCLLSAEYAAHKAKLTRQRKTRRRATGKRPHAQMQLTPGI